MELKLSERQSYGSGYHVVVSFIQYKSLSNAALSNFFSIADHLLVALHTHGFRDHVHIQVWTDADGFYTNVKKVWPDAHVTKINRSYFNTGAEVSCTEGYARVRDYILRERVTLVYEEGDFAKALMHEYLSDLNKYTLRLEKAALKEMKLNEEYKGSEPAANYRYSQALSQLGGRQDEQLHNAEEESVYLDLDEEAIDRDSK